MKTYLEINEVEQLENAATCLRDKLLIRLLARLDWEKYMGIADNFQHNARYEDRDDLRQDIVLRLAEVASTKTEPLTPPAMLRGG
jgi:hypothetical protein